jgi:hypothetical protein
MGWYLIKHSDSFAFTAATYIAHARPDWTLRQIEGPCMANVMFVSLLV